jgi:hypothetical protein
LVVAASDTNATLPVSEHLCLIHLQFRAIVNMNAVTFVVSDSASVKGGLRSSAGDIEAIFLIAKAKAIRQVCIRVEACDAKRIC